LETGLPWESLSLVRLFRPWLEKALPNHRFIDSIPVNPDSPQEDEIALANMTPISFYHALYFPKRFDRLFDKGVFLDDGSEAEAREWERTFLQLSRKVAIQSPGRTLVVKNPVYTARVKHILRIFPDARFIHIHRDPYTVFQSTVKMEKTTVPLYAYQKPDEETLTDFILWRYRAMYDAFFNDQPKIPEEQFAEVSFAELEADPLGSLARIYETLDLGDFAEARPEIEAYAQSISGYQKNTYTHLPDDVKERVAGAWAENFDRWGYET